MQHRVLTLFPMFHQGGSVLTICTLTLGATLCIPGAFEPLKTLEIIQDEGITIGAFPATVSNFLMKLGREERAGYDVSSVKKIINGASALMTETKEALLEYFPNMDLYEHLSCTGPFSPCCRRRI